MTAWQWVALGAVAALVLYGCAVAWLALAGRPGDARALAGFIPDCAVLIHRLLRDPRVPQSRKALLLLLLAYLATPIDLIPDFVPIAGQLDDALLTAIVLRSLLRASGEPIVRELWPGPERSLAAILRLTRP